MQAIKQHMEAWRSVDGKYKFGKLGDAPHIDKSFVIVPVDVVDKERIEFLRKSTKH